MTPPPPPPLRPLLPAPAQSGPAATSRPAGQTSRRRRAAAACASCRAKKAACDGGRPSCSRCARRGGRLCKYVTQHPDETPRAAAERHLGQVTARLAQHERLLRHLQEVPYDEAMATLRRLRDAAPGSAAATSAVLASLRLLNPDPAPASRPSELRAARAMLPPTYTRTEFELVATHGSVYVLPGQVACDLGVMFARGLTRTPTHLATHTLLQSYAADENDNNDDDDDDNAGGSSGGSDSVPPSPLRGVQSRRPSSAPLSPLRNRVVYCDERLRRLEIGYWTAVPVGNDFAANLLSVYLENEHPVVGAFDTETFIDGLVANRHDFCSPLLVSCVLAIASQCYTALDPRAGPLALAFIREAELLWRHGAVPPSAASLAALTTLSMVTMSQGQDALSLELVRDARLMAERLRVLGVRHTDELAARFRHLVPDALRALSHAAWGVYAWLGLHASYYGEEPVLYPPVLPIPGLASHQDGTEGAAAQAWPVHQQPAYMGRTFGPWCQLWTISQTIQAVFRAGDCSIPVAQRVPLAFVEQQYQQLLSWAAATLTGDLSVSPEDQADNNTNNNNNSWYPHALVFHAYLHIIVLDLFRPFLQHPRLHTLSSPDRSPQAVFDASFRQLRGLLARYCARSDPRLYNFYLNGAVLHVTHVVLRHDARAAGGGGGSSAMSVADRRFYMRLCMRWMREVYVRYAVIGKAAQAHMALALEMAHRHEADEEAAAAAAVVVDENDGEDADEVEGREQGEDENSNSSLVITAAEARAFLADMQRRARHHDLAGLALSCVVDFDLAMASRTAGRAQELARRFDELVLFDELTTGVVSGGVGGDEYA